MDSVLGLLALAGAIEIDFSVAEKSGKFSFNIINSIVCNLASLEDPRRSAVTHPAAPVRYRDDWRDDGMGSTFAQAALDRCPRDGTNLF